MWEAVDIYLRQLQSKENVQKEDWNQLPPPPVMSTLVEGNSGARLRPPFQCISFVPPFSPMFPLRFSLHTEENRRLAVWGRWNATNVYTVPWYGPAPSQPLHGNYYTCWKRGRWVRARKHTYEEVLSIVQTRYFTDRPWGFYLLHRSYSPSQKKVKTHRFFRLPPLWAHRLLSWTPQFILSACV